jgi:hypothetical protein
MSCPTATTRAAVPQGGQARRPKHPLTMTRPKPAPPAIAEAVRNVYGCPDCSSNTKYRLHIAVEHDPGCPKHEGIT